MVNSLISSIGHPNVSAQHKTTLELTKEDFLTPTGDCIIGINSDTACADLPDELKRVLKLAKKLTITLECNGITDTVSARGDPRLTLTSKTSMVIRKSDYVCDRTLCVRADKAAADLDRKLIEELKKGESLKVTLTI
jgi:hypothetical protein